MGWFLPARRTRSAEIDTPGIFFLFDVRSRAGLGERRATARPHPLLERGIVWSSIGPPWARRGRARAFESVAQRPKSAN
jgi:hypothetical protein